MLSPDLPSVWQREVPVEVPSWRDGGPDHVHLAIVGGGLMAAWLAHHVAALSGGRWDVAVLSDRAPGWGASGRNAGFVLGGTSELYALLVDQVGRAPARELLALSQSNRRLVRALLADQGAAEYQETGSLYLGAPDEEATLARTVAWLREDGVPAESWPLTAVPKSLSALGMPAAAFFPADGAVQPMRLVAALVRQAQAAGVQWFSDARVRRLADRGAALALDVGGRELTADRAVLCTNAWLGELAPALASVVRPARGQVLSLSPVALDYPYPVYADHGYLYWRPRPNGAMVLGGRRDWDPAAEWTDALALHEGIQGRLAALADRLTGGSAAITDRWAGIMGFTPDHLPVVGPVGRGVWVAGGFSGHGVAMTAAVGERLARHLIFQEPLPATLDPARFYAPA